ncbi:MAG: hypothetical protein F6K09_15045 [Merismopedia sp. SIO2A8]|nr:hypothetical protein [Symploca sp. SIO2B6]NET50001.1 hypothetical protein [Merismopedia sp. SIO2A8]
MASDTIPWAVIGMIRLTNPVPNAIMVDHNNRCRPFWEQCTLDSERRLVDDETAERDRHPKPFLVNTMFSPQSVQQQPVQQQQH